MTYQSLPPWENPEFYQSQSWAAVGTGGPHLPSGSPPALVLKLPIYKNLDESKAVLLSCASDQ